jgi:hypothetical protein
MNDISSHLAGFLRETEGLPPFRRNKEGIVEGWPDLTMANLSKLLAALGRSSRAELCEAILVIENADSTRLPHGILVLLSRAVWDAPAAPDPVKVSSRLNQGLGLRAALFGCDEVLDSGR